jgi:hypothetical protein
MIPCPPDRGPRAVPPFSGSGMIFQMDLRRSNFTVVLPLKFWSMEHYFLIGGFTHAGFPRQLNVLLPIRLMKRKFLTTAKSPQTTNVTAKPNLRYLNAAGVLLLKLWSMKQLFFFDRRFHQRGVS